MLLLFAYAVLHQMQLRLVELIQSSKHSRALCSPPQCPTPLPTRGPARRAGYDPRSISPSFLFCTPQDKVCLLTLTLPGRLYSFLQTSLSNRSSRPLLIWEHKRKYGEAVFSHLVYCCLANQPVHVIVARQEHAH